jgi:hypothetical protein
MQVIIQIVDEKGAVVIEHKADALHPTQFKRHPDNPIENAVSTVTGDSYKFYGFTYQPHVQLVMKSATPPSGPPATSNTLERILGELARG